MKIMTKQLMNNAKFSGKKGENAKNFLEMQKAFNTKMEAMNNKLVRNKQ